MSISRRRFLESSAFAALVAATGHAAEPGKIPTRLLGATGVRISVIGMGGGSRFLSYKQEDAALDAMNRAIDAGVTYIDTAYNYGSGLSETRVGKIMATRRKEVFLATKIGQRKGDDALRILEGSLKRLQTSQIDTVHIHQLMGEDDLAAIEAKDGVLNTLYKARDQKMIRFVGITCHTDPTVLKLALERHDFNVTQMALNAALVGMKPGPGGMVIDPAMKSSFETVALPVAIRKKIGVTAMKIFGADGLVGQVPSEKLLYYALSLPVAGAVLGMPKIEHILENAQMARAFKPLDKPEMLDLSEALSSKNKMALDRYLSNHIDSYTVA